MIALALDNLVHIVLALGHCTRNILFRPKYCTRSLSARSDEVKLDSRSTHLKKAQEEFGLTYRLVTCVMHIFRCLLLSLGLTPRLVTSGTSMCMRLAR